MRIVLDTDVVVAALRSPVGASAELIRLEKIAMFEAETYFTERQARADLDAFDRLMTRKTGEPPREGDTY